MRPLYIEGAPGCRVVLDEPALRVVMPDRSDRLFPLSRISNVVCSGVVEWSMSALLACADAGINLLFLHKNGEVRARWAGQSGYRQSLTQKVIDLLAHPDGLSRYQTWFIAMEKLAVRRFARRLGLPDWQEIPVPRMRKHLAGSLTPALQYQTNLLSALLKGELAVWLGGCGFDCHDEVIMHSTLDLTDDLGKLLLWDCYEYLLPGCPESDTAPMMAMALLFQQREDRLYLLFKGIISKFFNFLYSIY